MKQNFISFRFIFIFSLFILSAISGLVSNSFSQPTNTIDTNLIITFIDSCKVVGDVQCGNDVLKLIRQKLTEVKNGQEKMFYQKAEIKILRNIGNTYSDLFDLSRAMEHYQMSRKKAEEIGDKLGLAAALLNIGNRYTDLSDYPKALDYQEKSLKIFQEIEDARGIGICLNNLGNIYKNQSNYSKALEYFQNSLAIQQQREDTLEIMTCLNNIGAVYENLSDFSQAGKYYKAGLKYAKEINDVNGITISLAGIGNILYLTGKPKEAQHYYNEVLKLTTESKNLFIKSEALNWLRKVFEKQGHYKEALAMFDKHILLRDSIFSQEQNREVALRDAKYDSDKREEILKAEQEKKDALVEAESRRQQLFLILVGAVAVAVVIIAFIVSRSLHITRKQKYIIEEQKTLVEQQKYEVENQKHMIEEKQREIIDSITYAKRLQEAILPPANFIKKHLPDSFVLYKPKDIVAGDFYWMECCPTQPPHRGGEKKDEEPDYFTADPALYSLLKNRSEEFRNAPTEAEMAAWELLRENNTGYHIRRQHIIGKFIVDFVNIKTKTVIEIDGDIHDYQKEEDEIRTIWLKEKGFKVVRFRNKEVIDNPEKFIKQVTDVLNNRQTKVLPNGEDLGGAEVIFIAAADCTGHGVPGAMVSVVCSNALNRAVKEFGLRDTGKILDKVTELVLETFEKSDKDVKDGMDISLLAIQFSSPLERDGRVRLHWSGANNPLWSISNGDVVKITPNKQPIGKHDNRKPFTTHSIDYKSDTIFYLFTDGYADQFGGPKGKKFKYKQLEEKIISIHAKPLAEQQIILDKTFMEWKGNLDQVDDVCVIGIRI